MTDRDTIIDKDDMRARWRERGPHWDGQADVIAEMADKMNRPLIDAAEVRPGHVVLDLASGAGEPALTIAREIGPTGYVTATDLVDEMLAGCRRRADQAGLANIGFRLADMEALPFDDDSFDRVTCRFGIMFVPDPDKALREIRRVLKRGGMAALMIWGPRAATTIFSVFADAGRAVFGDDPRLDFDTQFRFGEKEKLVDLFTAAGFEDSSETDLFFEPTVPADRPFWEPQLQMSMGTVLGSASKGQIKALNQDIKERFREYRSGDALKLSVHAKIAKGSKPAT